MKKIFFASALVFSLALSLRADGTNQLTDEKSRVSYAIGLSIGHNFKRQELDLDPVVVGQAIKDVLEGNPELLTEDQVRQTLDAYKKEYAMIMQKKHAEEAAKDAQLAVKNKADGVAFLAANKNQPGVQTKPVVLPNGSIAELQYLVITNGTGPVPAATDTVKVNYRGTLINGTEFDSSFKHGQAATFPVNRVIPGWTQALEMMPVGSKWKLFLPSELAYGDKNVPGIPPGSVLIFDVELLSTQPAATPAAVAAAAAPPLTSDIIKVPSADEMKKGAKIEVIKPQDATNTASH